MTGTEPASPELVELLYREKFGLSWKDMQDEPAEAVELWVALEAARFKASKQANKPGGAPKSSAPLDPDDL